MYALGDRSLLELGELSHSSKIGCTATSQHVRCGALHPDFNIIAGLHGTNLPLRVYIVRELSEKVLYI